LGSGGIAPRIHKLGTTLQANIFQNMIGKPVPEEGEENILPIKETETRLNLVGNGRNYIARDV